MEKNGVQQLRYRAVCTSPYWAKEEIYTADLFEVVTPPTGPYAFTYFVNETDLAITDMPVAEMRLLSFDFDEFIWEHTGQTLSTAN